jgi:fatty-acyl-CoA synthase
VQLAAAIGRPDAHAGEIPVAYVQLKPGAQVLEQELIAFARARIGERAAIPKAIRIVPALPLTAVGKIFKPELKLRETEDALLEALRNAGIRCTSVKARNDGLRGTCVDIVLAAVADRPQAQAVVGQFAQDIQLLG